MNVLPSKKIKQNQTTLKYDDKYLIQILILQIRSSASMYVDVVMCI